MSHVTASQRSAMRTPARQQGALRFVDGGVVEGGDVYEKRRAQVAAEERAIAQAQAAARASALADADIEAYEKRRDKVAKQPADIQSMTHIGDKPRRPVQVDTGYFGKVGAGDAPYDVAGPASGALSTLYGLKTLPLYTTPAAPAAAASDFAEGFASGDPLQAGLGALGTPGRAAKAVGVAGAAMMPSDANAMLLGFGKARFAPMGRLRAAEDALGRQRYRGHVWEDEGVYIGKDGKPRWEIDDSNARMRIMRPGDVTSLDRAWDHPELFRQYPELKNVEVGVEDMEPGWGGYFDPQKNRIVISPYSNHPLGVIGHETQHAIQDLEGLAPGGHGDVISAYTQLPWRDTKLKLYQKYQQVGAAGMTAKELDALKAAQDRIKMFNDPKYGPGIAHELYRRSAGEAEARNVETRLGWDDELRRKTPPWQSADILEHEQYIHPSPEEMIRAVNDMNARVRAAVRPQLDDRARLMAYARELGAR